MKAHFKIYNPNNHNILLKYYKYLFLLAIVIFLASCGSGASNNDNSPSSPSPSTETTWEVVNTIDKGYNSAWEIEHISSSQKFESNFIFGIIDIGLVRFNNIPNKQQWASTVPDDPPESYKKLSCGKYICVAYSDFYYNLLPYANLHLYILPTKKYKEDWYNITPEEMTTESFSAINLTSESSFYVATKTNKIHYCQISYDYIPSSGHFTYVSDCQNITNDYAGGKINDIAALDKTDKVNQSVYVMADDGIWQLSSESNSWILMESSPHKGNSIKNDSKGDLFVASQEGGYFYDGKTWQQILNNSQNAVTLCDMDKFSGQNEKVYFGSESNANNPVSIFYPATNTFESITAQIYISESSEQFNTGFKELIAATYSCHIYGLSHYKDKNYVTLLK